MKSCHKLTALFLYTAPPRIYTGILPAKQAKRSVFELINYDVTDAVIIFDEKVKNKEWVRRVIKNSKNKNIPVIIIGDYYEDCKNIRFDYEKGFEQVVRHIVEEHNCRRLHFMAGIENDVFSDARLNVFKKVLEENKIPFSGDMVSYGEYWSTPTEIAMEKLIAAGDIPEAVICANDSMAITVCTVLKSHGYRVPDDVIVSGFDGIKMINFSNPRITSAGCDYADIADGCVKLVSAAFEGVETEKTTLVFPRLIPFESCGCCSAGRFDITSHLSDVNDRFYRFQVENKSYMEIAEHIQSCSDIESASLQIRNEIVYDMCCILNSECVDESVNPLTVREGEAFSDEMFIFFDSDNHYEFKPKKFMKKDIIPSVEDRVYQNWPLIFVALNYLNISLGYLCFHYHDCDIANYCKIPQTMSCLNNAIGGFRNMRYQQYLNRRIEAMYMTDSLTGLYNRVGFLKEYGKLIKRMDGNGRITIVLADLDGLKRINDSYGHGEGDIAIQCAADALRKACPEGALCMRFGGDEMIAVIENDMVNGEIRRKMSAYLDEYNAASGKPYKVSASVGVYATEVSDESEFEELVKKSDKLMYIEKAKKKSAE